MDGIFLVFWIFGGSDVDDLADSGTMGGFDSGDFCDSGVGFYVRL